MSGFLIAVANLMTVVGVCTCMWWLVGWLFPPRSPNHPSVRHLEQQQTIRPRPLATPEQPVLYRWDEEPEGETE